jgi:hypothetical protein
LTRRSLTLIAPEEGPAFLVDELQQGRDRGHLTGGAEQAARPARARGGQGVESRV